MNLGSLLFALALLIAVGLVLARPLIASQVGNRRRTPPFSRRRNLLARKEALIAQIEALDFDHATGKVPAELYEPQRAKLVQNAAEVLRKIDETTPQIDQEIESALAAIRLQQPTAPAPDSNGTPAQKSRFCPQCGEGVDSEDRFCANCGHQI